MRKQLKVNVLGHFDTRNETADNIVKVGYSVLQLTGVGTEYLVIDGNVIAKFFNGNLILSRTTVTQDPTVVPKAA